MKQKRLSNAHCVLVAAKTIEPALDEIIQARKGLIPRHRQVEAIEPTWISGKLALHHFEDAARDLVGRESLSGGIGGGRLRPNDARFCSS